MTKNKKSVYAVTILILCIVAIQACQTYYFRTNYKNSNALLHDTKNLQTKPFLKAHLINGDICILRDSWLVDTVHNVVVGNGIRYDFNRIQTYEGNLKIPLDSVAIYETNKKLINPEEGRITTLSILAGLDVVLGIYCLTVPKACFGSCPTFYVNEKDNFHYADAEGFSNAIAPSLEYYDIDALDNKKINDNLFSITMKNEALETHCVNDVKLLAYPRKKGERIYQSAANSFYLCENNYSVSKAEGKEGDITSLLKNDDRKERFSLADENNLSSKEEIYINFDSVKNTEELGLIINFRQTLMTTYLIYSALGYMGDEVSDIFADIERNGETRKKMKGTFKDELGDIDVYLWSNDKNDWELQDGFNETGPIALNRQILPLKNSELNSNVKVKLLINKGFWRIDYLALTNIKKQVKPLEIPAISIMSKGRIDSNAFAAINNPSKYLLSMPGSEYKFNFILPKQNEDYELFLYSKGYYLEWMRQHWIKDKNLLKLQQMVENSAKYLKEEAKEYKRYESTMEQEFWNSKIDTDNFSYYEN